MSQETYNTITSKTTLIEFVLYYEQFALLSELQEVFPDIVLACVTDQGNVYRAAFYVGGREIAQRRFLREHAIKYVERERERENIIAAFFRGVELEGNPIVTLTVRRVVDQPDYHSVKLTTHDDEMLLRFPSTWTFGQKSLLPVAAPLDDKQEP